MSNYNYEYIQFLNEKVLENLPTRHVRIGNKINMRCPLCGDSRKSAKKMRGWWYTTSGSFFCFNCSTGMSGIKFLEFISGEKYEDIRKEYFKMCFRNGLSAGSLSSQYEVPNEEPSLFELKSIVNPEWKKPLSDKARKYLEDRKVLQAPFYKDVYSCYSLKNNEEFIMIPWKLNGIDAYYQVNDFQKLHSLKYIFPKDKKKLLFGLDDIDLSYDKIIIFEGAYDSMFIKNGCATGTKSITDYQLDLLKERFPHHQLVVSFDNDEAGIDSMIRLLKKNNDFKYFRWFNANTKQKDVNDYVLAKGDVNLFKDPKVLDKLIVDKLLMKMWLLQNGMWKK